MSLYSYLTDHGGADPSTSVGDTGLLKDKKYLFIF
jgi:hypothetical protein